MKLTHKLVFECKTASPASVKSVSARRGAFEKCCPNYDDISDFTAQEMSQLTEELHLTKSQSFLEVGGGLVALYVAFNSNVGEVHGYEFGAQRHAALTKWLNELHLYRSLYHLAPHATELSKLKDFDVNSAAANVVFCNTAAIAKDVFSSVAEQLSDLMTPENILVLTTDPWTRATRSSPPPFKLYKIKTLDSGLEEVTSETTLYFFQHPDGTRPSELVQVEEVAEEAQRKTHLHATSPSRPKAASPTKTPSKAVAKSATTPAKSATSPSKASAPKATAAKSETPTTSTPKRRRNTEIFPSTKTEEVVASPRARAPPRRSLAPSASAEAVASAPMATSTPTPKRAPRSKKEEPVVAEEPEAVSTPAKRARAPASPSKASPAPRSRSAASKTESKPATPAAKETKSATPGGRSRAKPAAVAVETKMDEDPAPSVRSPRARASRSAATHMDTTVEDEIEAPVKSPASKKRRASVAAPPTAAATMEVDDDAYVPPRRVRAVKAKVEDEPAPVATSTPKKATRTSPAAKAATEVKKKPTASRAPVAVDDIDLPAPTNRRKRTRVETSNEESASSSSPAEANGRVKREAATNARESMKAVSHYIETDDEDDFEAARPKKKVVRSPIKSSKPATSAAPAPVASEEEEEPIAPTPTPSKKVARRAPKRTGASSTPARTSRARGFTASAPTSTPAPTEAPSQSWLGWIWNWIPGTGASN